MRSFYPFIFLLIICHYAKTQSFTEISKSVGIDHVTLEPHLMGGGVAVFDYNNDGWEDIYLVGGEFMDHLYENQGDGTFINVAAAVGLGFTDTISTLGVITGDIDNDGDRDVFLSADRTFHNVLLENTDSGFQDISANAGILAGDSINAAHWGSSATFGDYDQDGDLDLYVVNYVLIPRGLYDSTGTFMGFDHVCAPNYYYRNNGDGTFTEIGQSLNVDDRGCGLAVASTDYDLDHDIDIYVANDFGQWVSPSVLYENQLTGFAEVGASVGLNSMIYGMGIATGDYDEDGDFDYYISNLGRNILYQNNEGYFNDVTDAAGVQNEYVDSLYSTSWGTAFFDYDNDTYLDLTVSNGRIPAAQFIATNPNDPNKLYVNNQDGTFTDASMIEGVDDSTRARGMAQLDYDKDGDLDLLFVVVDNAGDTALHTLLYRNDHSNLGNWLEVSLEGTTSNKDAFGSLVEVVIGNRRFLRELGGGGDTHMSQSSSILHFGLGSYTSIDSLIVYWPGGSPQVITHLNANQLIHIIQGSDNYCNRDAHEPNNTLADASILPSVGILKTACLCPATDEDWYSFEVSSAKPHIRVRLHDLSTNYELAVYDDQGNMMAFSDTTGTTAEEIVLNQLSAGTYYVQVYGHNDEFDPDDGYYLNVDARNTPYSYSAGTIMKGAQAQSLAELEENNISLFPNPGQNELNIRFSRYLPQSINIQISDLAGKVLIKSPLLEANGLQLSLSTAYLPSGVYLVEVNGKVYRWMKQ